MFVRDEFARVSGRAPRVAIGLSSTTEMNSRRTRTASAVGEEHAREARRLGCVAPGLGGRQCAVGLAQLFGDQTGIAHAALLVQFHTVLQSH